MRSTGSRYRVFTDEQWQRIEPLLPSNQGRRGHPFGEHRRVVEGIAFRYRTGIPLWTRTPARITLGRPI
ncbi:transposase [Citricoccus nitrophenolicus]